MSGETNSTDFPRIGASCSASSCRIMRCKYLCFVEKKLRLALGKAFRTSALSMTYLAGAVYTDFAPITKALAAIVLARRTGLTTRRSASRAMISAPRRNAVRCGRRFPVGRFQWGC